MNKQELTTLAELLLKQCDHLTAQLIDDGYNPRAAAQIVLHIIDAADALVDKADVPEEEIVSDHPWLKGRLAGSCLA